MIRIKAQKKLHNWGNIIKMNTFFDSIAKKSKKAPPYMIDYVACKETRNKLSYIILHTLTVLPKKAKKPHHKC